MIQVSDTQPDNTGSGSTGEDPLEVAIVGGGVGGLYAGWRLLESRKYSKVALFEMSHRLGAGC